MSEPRRVSTRLGWLAAEFVAVVLGVAIGLAVDAWRESRSDAAMLVGYLDRLEADLRADRELALRYDSANSARSDTLLAFLRDLDAEVPIGDDPTVPLWRMTHALQALYSPPITTTYSELISQAGLRFIETDGLRDELAFYYAADAVRRRQIDEWMATAERVEFLYVERLDPRIYRWIQIGQNPTDRASVGVPELSREEVERAIAGIRSDPEFRNLLLRQAGVLLRLGEQMRSYAAMADALSVRVREARGSF